MGLGPCRLTIALVIAAGCGPAKRPAVEPPPTPPAADAPAPPSDDDRVAELLAAGKRERALDLAARTFDAEPGAHHSALLLCLHSKSERAACEAFLRHRPAEEADDDRAVLIRLGYHQIEAREAREVLRTVDDLEQRFPDGEHVVVNIDNLRCAAYALLGDRSQAIHWCERAVEHPDAVGSAYFNLGQVYLEAGRIDDAREQAERYAAVAPRYQRAAVLFTRLAELDGRSFEPSHLRARRGGPLDSGRAHAALARGDLAAAAAFARAHVTTHPWDSVGWQFLARVRWAEHRYLAAAIAWLIAGKPGVGRTLVESGTDLGSSLVVETTVNPATSASETPGSESELPRSVPEPSGQPDSAP